MDINDLKYITLRSNIYRKTKILGRWNRIKEKDQIVKHVIGEHSMVKTIEDSFFKEVESYMNYLRRKTGHEYKCNSFITVEHQMIFGSKIYYPVEIYISGNPS